MSDTIAQRPTFTWQGFLVGLRASAVLVPTIMIMLVLKCGQVMNIGYEKVFLLQNDANLPGSEVISTYVYKMGLESNEYSFSTATGLLNSIVNACMLLATNALSKRMTNASLW